MKKTNQFDCSNFQFFMFYLLIPSFCKIMGTRNKKGAIDE
ncbi:hypothetical protein CU026_1663 [Enterococcus faecium]|uniref:Uncharacterized protein n=2 Tax=Enterococcus faecium TaxID=1352 RepID=A0AB73A8B4_ENTFC|nr:hypothetical protein EfmE1071_1823 [Enterococcus faecium E1071]EFR68644.1 hypothetical protein HMPREF9524_01243 [Enterococcus faecium TX0133a01]EFR71183.1 hypothetical protein HMPREF9526_01786 [Enterococcus faecium TX0133B]EFR75229.1 hypothetical protein HMPREF9523_00822 [Enterococcus faecium TX0133A]EFR77753.1 hypothetical protein HMPREF9527_01398 [Enterococcus faecium TX0133C]EFS06846.1 hypothetical protein HMPREF9525_01014 [Enterococcus faecium TX0133a04]EFS10334.1 hypothetical protein 